MEGAALRAAVEMEGAALREEARLAQFLLESRRAQDRRLARLQWAVGVCWLGLLALLGLALYRAIGDAGAGKAERFPPIIGPQQNSNSKEIKPKAHLTGTRQSTAKTKDTYLQWESKFGLAYVMDGMRYENKSMLIPKAGYYSVYAQVSLKIPPNIGEHFVLQIVRLNNNYEAPEVLISGKTLRNGQQTIYLAGLLQLLKEDRLKVNVTAVTDVDISSEDKTFFGAFLVTE